MEIVRDQDDNHEEDQGDGETRRYPTQLRGRGGFGHAQGAGRGLGRGDAAGKIASNQVTAAPAVDPMDSLASGMSALKFIPHSVRMARTREKGSV